MYNPPSGQDIAIVLQALADNPLSHFGIRPQLVVKTKVIHGVIEPIYTEQTGWRATWMQVNSNEGSTIAWELTTTAKTPQLCLQQFAQDLQAAFSQEEPEPLAKWEQELQAEFNNKPW
jgi:hypothetical protein